jgi:hypothetical protein
MSSEKIMPLIIFVILVSQFEIIIFICSLFNDALSVTKTIQRRMKG